MSTRKKGVIQTKSGALRLEVAGRRKVDFIAAELPQMEQILTTAAGVVPRHGDVRCDIKAWKFVCGWNAQQIANAAARVQEHGQSVLAKWCPNWQEVSAKLIETVESLDVPVPEGDFGLFGIIELAVCDGWWEIEQAVGGENTEKIRNAVLSLFASEPDVRIACAQRQKGMGAVGEYLAKPVGVEVACVRWGKVPGGLSGGYMRELAWMFLDMPVALAALNDARKGVDISGADG